MKIDTKEIIKKYEQERMKLIKYLCENSIMHADQAFNVVCAIRHLTISIEKLEDMEKEHDS